MNDAVLFIVFNRPDPTARVMNAIREAKPPRLYVAADGPRNHKSGEKEKCELVRKIATDVTWPCEVKTLFQKENLGCGKGVSSAITWFFQHEEKGIILEDDIVPNLSFFPFCEELLIKYKDEKQIWQIGGSNFQKGKKRGDGDYYFSRYSHIWGWATWADRWKHYDFELSRLKDASFLTKVFKQPEVCQFWQNNFYKMKELKIDTWDHQWTFTVWEHEGLAIIPNKNLISNIGFSLDATHTKKPSEFSQMPSYSIEIKNHPSQIQVNEEADLFTFHHHYARPFLVKVWGVLKRYLHAR